MTRLSVQLAAGIARASVAFGPGDAGQPAAALAEAGLCTFTPDGAPAAAAVLTNDRASVEIILGAILAGSTLVSLPLPPRASELADYAQFVDRTCRQHGCAEVIAADELQPSMTHLATPVRPHSQLANAPLATPRESFRLIQCSSGSMSAPKAIELDDDALGANVASMLRRGHPDDGGAVVSWLPLSHDMGLIAMLVSMLVSAATAAEPVEIVLLEPMRFLRKPALWLETLADRRAKVTAAPDFAYRLCVQHPPRREVDLSSVNLAVVGGDIVRATTLRNFRDAFARSRFDELAFCPSYGLAEIGLSATVTPPEEPWRVVRVDPDAFAGGELRRDAADNATDLVLAGPPLDGYEIRIDAPDARVGPIRLRGPSLGVDATTGKRFGDADGWLDTHDVGALVDGWLLPVGRDDDYLVARGRNIFAPAIEDAINHLDTIRDRRSANVVLPTGEWIVFAEPKRQTGLTPADIASITHAVRAAVVDASGVAPDEILLVRRGTIPLTTSGKLRRGALLRRYASGDVETLA